MALEAIQQVAMQRQHDLCVSLALTSLEAAHPLLAAVSARLAKLLTSLDQLQQTLPVEHFSLPPAPVFNLPIELGRG